MSGMSSSGASSLLPAAIKFCIVVVATAALALSGCAQQPVKVGPVHATKSASSRETPALAQTGPEQPPATAPAKTRKEKLPDVRLTPSILYEFLLAEIAAQRGNIGLAAQSYVDLAKRTRDPRIARRATQLALFAHMGNAAIESAKVWHEADPGSLNALRALTGLLVGAGRLDEAYPYLDKLLKAAGRGTGEAFMQLGLTLSRVKDKSAALSLVQRLAEKYPQLPEAHYALARASADAGHDQAALDEVRRAEELKPGWEAAVLLEARLLQHGSEGAAIDRLSRYLQKYPNAREVRLAYARALVTDRRYAKARSEFERLLVDFPGNADVIYAVGLLSMQLSDYSTAASNFERLLKTDFPDKATVKLYLGQIAEDQKDYPKALHWYSDVGKGAKYLLAQIHYAQVIAKEGHLEEARAYLHRLPAKGEQDKVRLILAEAQMLREAKHYHEAYKLVGRELKSMPDNPDLLYDYAMLAYKIGRFDVLESSLKKVIKLRPNSAHAYNALGYTFADRNQHLKEAHKLIEKALKLAPNDAFIIDSMGWVLYRMGDYKESVKYLERALAGRADPEIAAHLGEVLWVTGKRAEAEKVLHEAVTKHPNNETLKETIRRLKR